MIKLFSTSQIMQKDEKLLVSRETVVTYVNGKPKKPKNIEFFVKGNVQPMNAKDLLQVPEHDRTIEQYWVYLSNQQFLIQDGQEVKGPSFILINDRITRLCGNYLVKGVENWGTYTKIRIMLIDVGRFAPQGIQPQ